MSSAHSLTPVSHAAALAALVSAAGRLADNGAQALLDLLPDSLAREVETAVARPPSDSLGYAVAIAERLASGGDKESPIKGQVQSVFAELKGHGDKDTRYLPMMPLEIREDVLFPVKEKDPKAKPQAMFDKLKDEMMALSHTVDSGAYIESLQALMQRYLWCVPCGYQDAKDIALYDHARVMAALAASLVTLDADTLKRLYENKNADAEVATFIEGDVSGIQRFIYSVPMRGATKQLRARSLYLQLLTEIIARYVLREFGLPSTNLLYAGGGHFYLVGTPHARDTLQAIIGFLERLLLKHHDGELYVALGAIALNAKDFNPSAFGEKWKALKEQTGAAKGRRYSTLDADEMASWLFSPRPQDGDDERSLRYSDRDEPEDDTEREADSQLGKSFKAFAQKLKTAEAMVIMAIEPRACEMGGLDAIFHELGFAVDLVYSDFKAQVYPERRTTPPFYAVALGLRGITDWGVFDQLRTRLGCPIVRGVRYTVNITPMVGDARPVEFDELSAASRGIKRLGVLRMDVDSLGALFGSGFKKPKDDKTDGDKPKGGKPHDDKPKDGKPDGDDRASLVRVSTLSSALSLFFEGWVGELCKRLNDQKRDIIDEHGKPQKVGVVYPVYSGGDDLFIVGAWDVLPQLAQTIHDDLTRYACKNPEVHISAGITLHTGRYPLYLAAEDAESALNAAKKRDGKDAISFLGQTVKWGADWGQVLKFRDDLRGLIVEKGANKSLLRVLMQLYNEYESARKAYKINKSGEPQIVWGPWMWHMAYQLNRLADRDKNNRAEIDDIHKRLSDRSDKSKYDGIVWAGIAARWVDALTRDKNEREER